MLQFTVPLVRLVTVIKLAETAELTLALAPATLKQGPPTGLTHCAALLLIAALRFPAESLALVPYKTLPAAVTVLAKVYVVAPMVIVSPAVATKLKVAVPLEFLGIALVLGDNAQALWEEAQLNGIGLPVILVTVMDPVFAEVEYVSVAVTLGFGAVINE